MGPKVEIGGNEWHVYAAIIIQAVTMPFFTPNLHSALIIVSVIITCRRRSLSRGKGEIQAYVPKPEERQPLQIAPDNNY